MYTNFISRPYSLMNASSIPLPVGLPVRSSVHPSHASIVSKWKLIVEILVLSNLTKFGRDHTWRGVMYRRTWSNIKIRRFSASISETVQDGDVVTVDDYWEWEIVYALSNHVLSDDIEWRLKVIPSTTSLLKIIPYYWVLKSFLGEHGQLERPGEGEGIVNLNFAPSPVYHIVRCLLVLYGLTLYFLFQNFFIYHAHKQTNICHCGIFCCYNHTLATITELHSPRKTTRNW